jgi:hypothetical protein
VAPYRSVVPHALDRLAEALTDRAAPPRQISGELTITSRGFEIAPIGLFVDGVIVPDLLSSSASKSPLKSAGVGIALLPSIDIPLPPDPIGVALLGAWSRMEEVAHRGLLRLTPAWIDAMRMAAARLRELGLTETAASLDRLAAAVAAALDGVARREDAVSVWETAAIRLMALSEALETPSSWPGGSA